MRQTVEAVTGQNILSALATPVPQAPKPVVKQDWANCSEHKETLNIKNDEVRKEKNYILMCLFPFTHTENPSFQRQRS